MYIQRRLLLVLFVALFSGVAHAQSVMFSSTLMLGSSGPQVLALQQILNRDPATEIARTGPGSPGEETGYFGLLTKVALVRFQNKYASRVLAPAGLTQATGVVGVYTRAFLNMLVSTPTVSTTPTTVTSPPAKSVYNTGAVIGMCGGANDTNATTAPSTSLCLSGTVSPVAGTGPWNWTCAGSYGGTTATCSTASRAAASAAAPTPSPSGTTIPTAVKIIDSALNTWTVSGGVVYKNNGGAGYTVSIILLLYFNGTIYDENRYQNWQMWTGGAWASINGDPRVSVASANGVCGVKVGVCATGTPTAVSYGASTDVWNCQGVGAGISATCSTPAAQ